MMSVPPAVVRLPLLWWPVAYFLQFALAAARVADHARQGSYDEEGNAEAEHGVVLSGATHIGEMKRGFN